MPSSHPHAESPTEVAVIPEPATKVNSGTKDPVAATHENDVSETPLARLWTIAQAHSHPEIWGVTLADPATHIPTQIVLQKFLNANDGDMDKTQLQLTSTLDWRARMQPLELTKKAFSKTKFGSLGFVTTYTVPTAEPAQPSSKEVFNWNIYGGAKSLEETFGDLTQFLEWRVAIMELALYELSLASATKPLTATDDPYKITQVHDYKSISFLRQPPYVKAASTETIKVFAQNYPELLKEKFFVNVPVFMGFMYALIKPFLAAKTAKKFHPMTNGADLAREFPWGEQLPVEYGGKGAELAATGKETLHS